MNRFLSSFALVLACNLATIRLGMEWPFVLGAAIAASVVGQGIGAVIDISERRN